MTGKFYKKIVYISDLTQWLEVKKLHPDIIIYLNID